MSAFWSFARGMLRYRARTAGAVVMAFVSAGGLGAGIVTLIPVLRNILGEDGQTLPTLAGNLDARIGGVIPDSWYAGLPDDRFLTVLTIIGFLGVLTTVGAAANFLHQYLSMTICVWTVADIRRSAFRLLVRLPLAEITGGNASDLTSRIVNDSNILSRGFQALTDKAVAHISKGLAALIAALVIDWRLTLVTLLVAPVLFVIIRKIGKRIRRASRQAMKSQAQMLGVANETMTGFRVIKVMGGERYELGRFSEANRAVVKEQLRVRTMRALASPIMELIAIFVLGTLAVVAAKQIIDGELEPVRFFLALAALGIAGQSLKPLNSVIQDIQIAEAAAGRLRGLFKIAREEERDASRGRLARHAKSVAFDDVRFTYPGAERAALDGVSLEIPYAERVALVGPNGSGKTTMMSLLPRLFEPDSGRILIDGVDIATVTLRSLRSQIGVVPQETVLFRGTVSENIAYAYPGATREQVKDAARRAYAESFILELPDGYDTQLGDQGMSLSGGQRQRIAIARAIIRDPSILLMDEATSMIDAESERLIGDAVRAFSRGRTVIVIAHRLSTVIDSDRIVVMDAGRIVDQGTHTELLERCSLYRQLAQHQLAGEEAHAKGAVASSGGE